MLSPLYLLGLLAVSLPVVFHLIRQMPRGRTTFSSLMFVTPSPPRITRNISLENILLLLLRAAILILLAIAFCRPFFRSTKQLESNDWQPQRVLVLVDTSASMRRGDLWTQAQNAVQEVVSKLQPRDRVALFRFDGEVKPLLGFSDQQQTDARRRAEWMREQLQAVQLGWSNTDVGQALVMAADTLEGLTDADAESGAVQRRIVLISDLQSGSQTEALQAYEWPDGVTLELRILTVKELTNAALQWLADSTSDPDQLRVRVSNSSDAAHDRFQLTWDDQEFTDVYVPPGESRVVNLSVPATAERLTLSGDDHDFDNVLFVTRPRQAEFLVGYAGSERRDDVEQPRYYLERVFTETPQRKVRVASLADLNNVEMQLCDLIVVHGELAGEYSQRTKQYLDNGGTLVMIETGEGDGASLNRLLPEYHWKVTPQAVDDYVMLGAITFSHSLFVPLASPQFSDFTKIHFWNYRRVEFDPHENVEVIARFENQDPAILDIQSGNGHVLLLASGWQPRDSQLALSTKFVPLLSGLLSRVSGGETLQAAYRVGETVRLPARQRSLTGIRVQTAKGEQMRLTADADSFEQTDTPGLYEMNLANHTHQFAVNLDSHESQTSVMPTEQLEQLGVMTTNAALEQAAERRQRQLRDVELEGQQRVWWWLLLAALAVVLLETWLAGRVTRQKLAASTE